VKCAEGHNAADIKGGIRGAVGEHSLRPQKNTLIYREMGEGEAEEVSALIVRSFHRHIAHRYRPEGIENFLAFTQAEQLRIRRREGQLFLVAVDPARVEGSAICGVIAVRDGNHISLLFVDESSQRRGIASSLIKEAISIIRHDDPDVRCITVNSSPYAAAFYERVGFQRTGPEQYRDGMLLNPMTLSL
jgi:ribosomal protein S18 acetylase RimI-like enzyme